MLRQDSNGVSLFLEFFRRKRVLVIIYAAFQLLALLLTAIQSSAFLEILRILLGLSLPIGFLLAAVMKRDSRRATRSYALLAGQLWLCVMSLFLLIPAFGALAQSGIWHLPKLFDVVFDLLGLCVPLYFVSLLLFGKVIPWLNRYVFVFSIVCLVCFAAGMLLFILSTVGIYLIPAPFDSLALHFVVRFARVSPAHIATVLLCILNLLFAKSMLHPKHPTASSAADAVAAVS